MVRTEWGKDDTRNSKLSRLLLDLRVGKVLSSLWLVNSRQSSTQKIIIIIKVAIEEHKSTGKT